MAAEVTQLTLAVDSRQVRTATTDLNAFGRTGAVVDRQAQATAKSTATLTRAFAGLGAALSVREVVRYADAYQQVNARLRLVTGSAADFSRVQGVLIQQANQTRSSLTETIDLYSRVARATRNLNATDTDRLRFTEAINKALIVSGASGASAQAALVQLGQGLASGVVRGEEFNSIAEQAPRILEAVAQSLGKTSGELRKFAADGQLSAEVFFNAFLGGADGIDREFQRIPSTIGQALVVADNRLQQFIGGTSEASGAGRSLAVTIDVLSRNIDVLAAAAAGLAATKLASVLIGVGVAAKANLATYAATTLALKAQQAATLQAAQSEVARTAAVQAAAAAERGEAAAKIARLQVSQAAIVSARAETIATLQSTQATIASAQAQLTAAKAAGALSFAIASRNAAEATIAASQLRQAATIKELDTLGKQQATVQASIATATTALTAATNAQSAAAAANTVAQKANAAAVTATAAAASTASRVVGLLGGPIGIITTLLGLGASAWILWGNSAAEATEKASNGMDLALRRRVRADVEQLNAINAELVKFRGNKNPANDVYIRELEAQRASLTAAIDQGRKTLETQQNLQEGQDRQTKFAVSRRPVIQEIDTSTAGAIRARIEELEKLRDAAKIGSAEFKRLESEIDSLDKKLIAAGLKKAPGSAGAKDKPDFLSFDLAKVRRDLDGLTAAFSVSESILEAQRNAGLVADREYFEAKIAFVNLNRDAQVKALQAENARLAAEKGNNSERLDNQKQIADNEARIAILRAQSAGQITTLAIQQVQANNAAAKSFRDAEAAAQDYLDTLARGQDRELAGRGIGTQERDRLQGRQGIEDRFSGQRQQLESQRREAQFAGTFGPDEQKKYDEELDRINRFQASALSRFESSYKKRIRLDKDFNVGVAEAAANYVTESANVAKQIERAFTSAFKGAEDALVGFITTGKLDFKSLANSIIADITRIIVKQQIMGPLIKSLGLDGSGGSGGAWSSIGGAITRFFGSLFGGPRAIGGPVSAGRLYEVNEKRPEMLTMGGRDFLMMGSQGGNVTPNGGGGGGSVTNINVSVAMPQGGSRATALQFGTDAARQISRANSRNG